MPTADCPYNTNHIAFFDTNEAVDEWTLSDSGSLAGHPVTEITNTSPGMTWRSDTTGAAWIQGDRISGTGKADSIVIVNHNEGFAGQYSIEFWNGSILNPPDFTRTFFAKPHANLDNRDLIDQIRPYQSRVYHFGETVENWITWRLTTFIGSPGYHQIGRIFLTTAFRPKDNIYRAGLIPIDKTRVDETAGGQSTSDNRPRKRGLNIYTTDAMRNYSDIPEWLRLIHIVGKREPIFIDPYPEIPDKHFLASEESKASINLCWQAYGTFENNFEIVPDSLNTFKMTGSGFLNEDL